MKLSFFCICLLLLTAVEAAGQGVVVPLGDKFYVIKNRDKNNAVTTVTSAAGRVWMDRNLGAGRVAQSFNDSEAFGDLYQWGRLTDGHEKRDSLMTETKSSTDVPGHGKFIIGSYDWRDPNNPNLWQGVSGINNPCPDGFRLPTPEEWETERLSWSINNRQGAFASPLKLVTAGSRNGSTNELKYVGLNGSYWSSNGGISGSTGEALHLYTTNVGIASSNRIGGFSVRCIQD